MPDQDPVHSRELALHLLVLRCQTGDQQAFATLMGMFGGKTLGYLRGILGQDAEDVQQEVWLAVYRGLHTLTNPGAFRTWLFRTSRHRVVDHLRRLKRERELLDDVPLDEVGEGDLADDRTIENVEGSLLDGALDAMPPPHREVLLLRYRDELSYAEIALVIGRPIGTVRTRLHHAKRRLHTLLNRGTP
jgi:RNA polymerase sigma-70 factor, ECF subfamily